MTDRLEIGVDITSHSEGFLDVEARVKQLKRQLEGLKKFSDLGPSVKDIKAFENVNKVIEQSKLGLSDLRKEAAEMQKAFAEGRGVQMMKELHKSIQNTNSALTGRINTETKLTAATQKRVKQYLAGQELIQKNIAKETRLVEQLGNAEAKLEVMREKDLRRRNRQRGTDQNPFWKKGLVEGPLGRNFKNGMKGVLAMTRAAEAAEKLRNQAALKSIADGIKLTKEAQRIEDEGVKAGFDRYKYLQRVKLNSHRLEERAAAEQAKAESVRQDGMFASIKRRMGLMDRSQRQEERDANLSERQRKRRLVQEMADERVKFSVKRHHLETEEEYIKRMHGARRRAESRRKSYRTHALTSAREGFHAVSQPYFSSPAFAAEATLTAALIGLTHAVEQSREFDKQLTDLQIRAGLTGRQAEEEGRRARILGADYGVGGDEILKIQTESASRGLAEGLRKGLAPTILKFSESIGRPAAETADDTSDFIQQLASLNKFKSRNGDGGLGEAHRTLNTAAILANRFGGGERMLQSFSNGLAEAGNTLGLNPRDTLTMGALFNASGAKTGRMSVMAMRTFAEQAPGWKDKWKESLRGDMTKEKTRLMVQAPKLLGYGNIEEMQKDGLGQNGMGGILKLITSFRRITNMTQRRELMQELGFTSETAPILGGIIDSPKNVRDAMKLSRQGWNETDDKNDTLAKNQKAYRQHLSYTTAVIAEAFDNIEIAVGEGLNKAILLKVVHSFSELTKWSVHELPKIVEEMIHGFVQGLGFHREGLFNDVDVMVRDISRSLKSVNWKTVGTEVASALKGVGEGLIVLWHGIKGTLEGVRSIAKLFGFKGGSGTTALAKLATELAGFALALHFLTPVVGILKMLSGGLMSFFNIYKMMKQSKLLGEIAANTGGGVAAAAKGGRFAFLTKGLRGLLALDFAAGAAGLVSLVGGLAALIGLAKVASDNNILQAPKSFDLRGFLNFLDPNLGGLLLDGKKQAAGRPGTPSGDSRNEGLMQLNSYEGGEDPNNWRNLLTKASYEPSDHANRAKDAVIETRRGVFEVREAIEKLTDVVRNGVGVGSAMGGIGGLGGGVTGSGSGPANMRYGRDNAGSYHGTPSKGGQGGGMVTGGAGGSRSWRNNNPGNIEYGPYAKSMGAIGSDGRFAVFPSYESGRKAQEHLLFESGAYKNLTLAQAIGKWAPASENNVPAYLRAMGGNPNTRMSDFSPEQRVKLLDAMQAHEGWKVGTRKNTLVAGSDPGSVGGGSVNPVASDSPEVAAARRYLLATATGPAASTSGSRSDSISKLNPAFVLKAAEAIRRARAEGIHAGIFSGYRKPTQTGSAYDANGFSSHSYGIGSDFSGIGTAGSATSRRFDEITRAVGLGGYGPDNRAEFNHKELGVHLQHDRARLDAMKRTLGPNGEMINPEATWAASGYAVPKGMAKNLPTVKPDALPSLTGRRFGGFIKKGGAYAVKPKGEVAPANVAAKVHGAMLGGKAARTQMAGNAGSTVHNTFHVHGAQDPNHTARIVAAHISAQHANQTVDTDFG